MVTIHGLRIIPACAGSALWFWLRVLQFETLSGECIPHTIMCLMQSSHGRLVRGLPGWRTIRDGVGRVCGCGWSHFLQCPTICYSKLVTKLPARGKGGPVNEEVCGTEKPDQTSELGTGPRRGGLLPGSRRKGKSGGSDPRYGSGTAHAGSGQKAVSFPHSSKMG